MVNVIIKDDCLENKYCRFCFFINIGLWAWAFLVIFFDFMWGIGLQNISACDIYLLLTACKILKYTDALCSLAGDRKIKKGKHLMMEALDLTNQNYKTWNNMPWLGLIAALNKGCSLLHFLEQEAHYLILLSTHHELLLILFWFYLIPRR